jgi:hypothetical protein
LQSQLQKRIPLRKKQAQPEGEHNNGTSVVTVLHHPSPTYLREITSRS